MDRTTKLLQTFLRLTQSIRKSNPLLLLMLGFIPLCLVLWRLEEKNLELHALTTQIERLEQKSLSSNHAKATRDRLWDQAKKSDPLYLPHVLESLPLLTPELLRVQALARQYPANSSLQERLSFLQGDKNRIRFSQQAERRGPAFQETEFKMQSAVQMNEDDLKNFLAAIEEGKDRPLLFIKDFELKRTKEKSDEMVYNIQAELIKRMP